ncbi:MAG: hypothetical protein WCV67_09425 [Victivallaceae bacterium]|jgi:hypothetical protein
MKTLFTITFSWRHPSGDAGRLTGFLNLFAQSGNSRKPVRRPALPDFGFTF